ncbi:MULTISPECIES: PhoH family protein [unclassified Mesotoga]|uniref:PhoH family protein n=1 Tax=unclassified Mesotoga TaxID=1184398 RepID=UPI000EF28F96|nr:MULTISPECIES: PhoH family protein [unclassified Mesotoga]MDI9367301.1 PhoH family protein [Thermotogota bacterium]NLT45752.1 PhoH family protein [Thermotogaceae bacterium]MDD3681048.1 PhoH family protein [Mesotoga sp.]MDD4207103.1 PhoH family protein [Mesotoga sp.]MDD4825502.1 PhoH family protein [Mesotoga sp.]
MIKNFILDTNVLVHDPYCFENFEDNNIIIPFPVLEEIDKLKKNSGSVGQNARKVNRFLDSLRSKGRLTEGVRLESGGTLRIAVFDEFKSKLPPFAANNYKDNAILLYMMELSHMDKLPVILVSKDINMRVKADIMGLKADDYLHDKVEIDDKLSGINIVDNPSLRDKFIDRDELSADELPEPVGANEFVDFGREIFGRVSPDGERVVPLEITMETSSWGIMPRNNEQMMAMELLLDDDVRVVFIPGMAGTGKTLISLACGLRKVVDEKKYERLMVARPIIPMGQDIGYLPGSMEEKIDPWMTPIYDNLYMLFNNRHTDLEVFLKKGEQLQVEVLSYIRGRSIPNQYFIIDEAQNLSPHEIKTIITRVGENTKIVIIGDPYQIDNSYLDAYSNGLTYAASRLTDKSLAGHITLTKGERSELASLAAELL